MTALEATPFFVVNGTYRLLAWLGAGTATLMVAGFAIQYGSFLGPVARWLGGFFSTRLRIGRKVFAAKSTATDVNDFLGNRVFAYLADIRKPSVAITWVAEAKDLKVLDRSEDELIVRIRHETVPEHNQLAVLMSCIEYIFFPHVWGYFSPSLRAALRLHFASVMAEGMGGLALRYYSLELLKPAVDSDGDIQPILASLRKIEDAGLFEAVLLQDFVALNDRLILRPADGVNDEALAYIAWLRDVAEREEGSQGELLYIGEHLRTALLLAARFKTERLGTGPYTNRTVSNMYAGATTMFLVGLTKAHHAFAQEIMLAIREGDWVKFVKLSFPPKRQSNPPDTLFLAQFRRNDAFMGGKRFSELANELGLAPGSSVEAIVRGVSMEMVILRHESFEIFVKRGEAAWGLSRECHHLFLEGDTVSVLITAVDDAKQFLTGSIKRASLTDETVEAHIVDGAEYDVIIVAVNENGRVFVRILTPMLSEGAVYGRIEPLSWSHFDSASDEWEQPVVGESVRARVVKADVKHNFIELSRTSVKPNDWLEVIRAFPPGREVAVKVIRVDSDGVVCQVADGVVGRIKADSMRIAGFEFARFTETLVPGQTLDAVVTGAKVTRQFLQLDLQRNRSPHP